MEIILCQGLFNKINIIIIIFTINKDEIKKYYNFQTEKIIFKITKHENPINFHRI